MPFAAAIPLIGSAVGAIGGALGNRSKTSTYGSDQSSKSTATTTRNLLPFQQDIIPQLTGYTSDLLTNPGKLLAPIRQQGVNQINRNYARVPQQLADRLLSFGGNASGKFGRALRESELARQASISSLDSALAQQMLAQQGQGASLAEQLLGMNFGSTVSQEGSSSSSGYGTQPGNAAAGGIAGGFGGLGAGLDLFSVLKDMGIIH